MPRKGRRAWGLGVWVPHWSLSTARGLALVPVLSRTLSSSPLCKEAEAGSVCGCLVPRVSLTPMGRGAQQWYLEPCTPLLGLESSDPLSRRAQCTSPHQSSGKAEACGPGPIITFSPEAVVTLTLPS